MIYLVCVHSSPEGLYVTHEEELRSAVPFETLVEAWQGKEYPGNNAEGLCFYVEVVQEPHGTFTIR